MKRLLLLLGFLAATCNAQQVNLATQVQGILPVANGGTNTATPGLVAGTNITISGTWPNQTIVASATGATAWSGITAATNANTGSFIQSGNTWDFTAAVAVFLRSAAALTASANGDIGYDTTHTNWHAWNGADAIVAVTPVGTPVNGQCATWIVGSSHVYQGSAACLTGTVPIASGGTGTTNNPIKRLLAPWGVCNATVSGASWGLPASGGAVPTCPTPPADGLVYFDLAFAQSQIAYNASIIVPADWQSFGAAKIWFTTSDVTSGHTIIFDLQTACVAPNGGNVINPTFNTAQAFTTVTIGGSATANASYSTSISSVTGTGCAAGSTLYLKFYRNGSDTSTDAAVGLINALELDYNGTYQ